MFSNYDETALFFSMFDMDLAWCRKAAKPFSLDQQDWKSAEHYVQAMRFEDSSYRAQICEVELPDEAITLGKNWLKRKRKGWKESRVTMMTRALYMQSQVHPEMASSLLNTGDRILVEDSQYDYFWGCGRDRRGDNNYGKILMNIRTKLREKADQN